MKDQTVRRKERTDRRRGRTGPLARLHDVTHTHTETHKSEADPRMIFLLSSSVTPPGNQSSCLCLLHTVCLSVYMYSGVYICMCGFAWECVCGCLPLVPVAMSATFWNASRKAPVTTMVVLSHKKTANVNLTKQIKYYIRDKVCLHLCTTGRAVTLTYRTQTHQTRNRTKCSNEFTLQRVDQWFMSSRLAPGNRTFGTKPWRLTGKETQQQLCN